MNLYALDREKLVSYVHCESLPQNIEFRRLDDQLFEKIKADCNGMDRQWKQFLRTSSGMVAVALVDGKLAAYGHLKTKEHHDTFYKIGKRTAYLSSFFTAPEYRGCGIYPAVISYLVETNPQYQRYYISAYVTNRSSINGLTKAGFARIKTLTFLRIGKLTVNKYQISSERD